MGCEVMNYIDELIPPENRDRESEDIFDDLEINLYLTDRVEREEHSKAVVEFKRFYQNRKEEQETSDTRYLSQRTQKSDIERIERLNSILQAYYAPGRNIRFIKKEFIARLSELIELSQSFMRA